MKAAPHFGFVAFVSALCLASAPVGKIRVVRDTYGVPHIFAPDTEALFEAYGEVVVQDRLWQLEMARRASRGQLAALFGGDYAEADSFVRGTGYTEAELMSQFQALPPMVRNELAAYARGINHAAKALQAAGGESLPLELRTLQHDFAPWQVTDTLAVSAFMMRRFGEIGGREVDNYQIFMALAGMHDEATAERIFDDLYFKNDPAAPTTIPAGSATARPRMRATRRLPEAQRNLRLPKQAPPLWAPLPAAPGSLDDAAQALRSERFAALWQGVGVVSRLGSYAWAVSPKHSSDGRALLYGGPQMGVSAPEVVHEVQLHSDDGFDVLGMAFAGVPYVLIGRTRGLAWTSTTAVGDNVDIYYETLCETDSKALGQRYNGDCIALQQRQETVEVRGEAPRSVTLWRSLHGPALPLREMGIALAQKRAHWGREAQGLVGFRAFNQSRDVYDFGKGIADIVTQHNFVVADTAGNIGYWQAGVVPRRPPATDGRLPLPGDGTAEWPGGQLPTPSVINPPQGFVANWNNKPQVDFDSADSRFFGKQDRVSDVLARLQAGKISFDDCKDIVRDIARVPMEGRKNRHMQQFLRRSLQDVPGDPEALPAAQALLLGWSGNVIDDARHSTQTLAADVLFDAFWSRLRDTTFGPGLGHLAHRAPLSLMLRLIDATTPGGAALPLQYDYLRGRNLDTLARTAFIDAVHHLQHERGSDVAMWGNARPLLPVKHALFGKLFDVPLSNRATYGQVLALSPIGIDGENIFSLGQSGLITQDSEHKPKLSQHFADLLPLYLTFEHKPMLWLAPQAAAGLPSALP